jgi:hypothetical protein
MGDVGFCAGQAPGAAMCRLAEKNFHFNPSQSIAPCAGRRAGTCPLNSSCLIVGIRLAGEPYRHHCGASEDLFNVGSVLYRLTKARLGFGSIQPSPYNCLAIAGMGNDTMCRIPREHANQSCQLH